MTAPDSSAPTQPDYEAIEARCEAATGGEWCPSFPSPHGPGWEVLAPSGDLGDELPIPLTAADADFIAAARTDVPAMLARCQWLEGHVAKQAAVIEAFKAVAEALESFGTTDVLRHTAAAIRRAFGE